MKKELAYTTIASLCNQLIAIICGLILPRLILVSFGSQINGLVNSISQFLSIICFLDLGISSVVQSALYRPLVDNSCEEISAIIKSATIFFRKIATIMVVYVIVIVAIYPYISGKEFSWWYSATLIGAMAINTFSQYYFGMAYKILILADQKGYIVYLIESITMIINLLISIFLLEVGASIQIVKLCSSIIFLVRPIVFAVYVNRNYKLNMKIVYSEEPIKQKWNGIAQHIASVVLTSTDTIVLTFFSTLSNVSVYAVYNLVITGVKQLLLAITNGILPVMGEYWAKGNKEKITDTFEWIEWVIHNLTILLFGCTTVLIVPFVMIYTKGVDDAMYNQPLFAIAITLAHASHCIRLPYNYSIFAAGHYKETQSNYIITACINICISIICVKHFGLIGVAIGTLVAMIYQSMWMAYYDSKYLVKRNILRFYKQLMVDVLVSVLAGLFTFKIGVSIASVVEWIKYAVIVSIVWFVICFLINLIFYRKNTKCIIGKISSIILRQNYNNK